MRLREELAVVGSGDEIDWRWAMQWIEDVVALTVKNKGKVVDCEMLGE